MKWKEHAPMGFFGSEADGLDRLRESGAVRVPRVLHLSESSEPAYLVLEYIRPTPPGNSAGFARRFGLELAELHRYPRPSDAGYGLERDNYIGLVPQINTPTQYWADFYRDARLIPQISLARSKGLLPPERYALVMKVVERLEPLLDGLEPSTSLLHGDLWSGNYLISGMEPVLFDPAVYYGEREIEIAYMELFSGFPSGVLAAYREAYPLQPGYEKRRPVHQVYPLLNHLNHFGESYGPQVEAVCRASLRGSA